MVTIWNTRGIKMTLDKAKMYFLEKYVNCGGLIEKQYFLELSEREKVEYINFVSKRRNCDAMISIKNNEYYYSDTDSKIEDITDFAERWDESGYKFFED